MEHIDVVHRSRVWRDGELLGENLTAEQLDAFVRDPECLVWLDLVDPTPAELEDLGHRLGIGATSLEDAAAPHERPKVSRHDSHLFFTTYATRLDPVADQRAGRLRVSRISGFVLPRALVTVRLGGELDLAPVLATWDDNRHLLAGGSAALVHGLLDVVVDGHFDTIQELDDRVEALEDVLFEEQRTGKDFLRQVYGLRKDLVELRRVVLPMREVVNGLLRHHRTAGAALPTELDSWYDDLYDHVLRASEWTESLRDMVTSLFETNLSLQDSRLNTVMKQLAAWAAIIAVPTAITGWYGMNVPYPGDGQVWGFWMAAVLAAVCPLVLWWVFRCRDWL